MKTLFAFVLGLIVGAASWHVIQTRQPGATHSADGSSGSTLERARAEARGIGDEMAARLREWNLSTETIKRELESTGHVIRNKARAAGSRIDDARVLTVLRAKYVLEEDLSTAGITVECRQGQVTLRGEAPSEAAVARAVALALETEGVTGVTAQVTVEGSGK